MKRLPLKLSFSFP